jgi:hypothetical protein
MFGMAFALALVSGCVAEGEASLEARGDSRIEAEPQASSGTCVAGDMALAADLRAQAVATTSLSANASALFRGVVVDGIAGTALEMIDLGSVDSGFDYTFDAATNEYVVTAQELGVSARGELRFRLYWGEGHPRAGEPLRADAFASDSYLVDPDLDFDIFDARLTVSYASAGPLVSLFGWGEQPKNPAVVRVSDADHVQENVRGLLLDARIIIKAGGANGASTSIELATDRKSIEDWIADPKPELRLVAGVTSKGNSKLTIVEWTDATAKFETSTGVKGELDLQSSANANFACR